MNKLNNFLRQYFECELAGGESLPFASYYRSMDYVEYVTVNQTTISHRIDDYLTLICKADKEDVVGFRINGFECIFSRLKPILDLQDSDLLPLVSVIEEVVRAIGEELIDARRTAYRKVYKLAKSTDAVVTELPLAA